MTNSQKVVLFLAVTDSEARIIQLNDGEERTYETALRNYEESFISHKK